MKLTKLIWAMLIALSLSLVACDQEGPAERMGENIDEAAEEIGDEIEDACEEVDDETDADLDC